MALFRPLCVCEGEAGGWSNMSPPPPPPRNLSVSRTIKAIGLNFCRHLDQYEQKIFATFCLTHFLANFGFIWPFLALFLCGLE